MLGEGRAAEIDREFKKAVVERLEPYWKDIQTYEHGGLWARLRVQIKYTFRDRSAECDVPKYVLQAIVDDMLPDIRAFFEFEEGKHEFEEWKRIKELKKYLTHLHFFIQRHQFLVSAANNQEQQ